MGWGLIIKLKLEFKKRETLKEISSEKMADDRITASHWIKAYI